MIDICAAEKEAEIRGTVDDLLEVGLAITALISSAERSVVLPASVRDPAPYDRALSELVVVRSSGPTLVSAQGSRLTVSGADESLARFASWFEFCTQPGQHAHFEPLPGDPDHSSESVPLVMSTRRAGA